MHVYVNFDFKKHTGRTDITRICKSAEVNFELIQFYQSLVSNVLKIIVVLGCIYRIKKKLRNKLMNLTEQLVVGILVTDV